jgi:hypothetical protein
MPAQGVAVSWNASQDPTVRGFYVYIGTNSGVYLSKTDVGTNTTFMPGGLVAGVTYYFAGTSYNAAGLESFFTPEIAFIIPGSLTLSPGGANGDFRLQFPVAPEHYYELQSSTNLGAWTDLWVTPVESSNIWVEFDQPYSSTVRAEFFRLILH